MAERIDLPPQMQGTAEEQLQLLRNYLYRVATVLNVNQDMVGNEAVSLTDEERILMNNISKVVGSGDDTYYPGGHNYQEAETLKSLIIKTAKFVKTVQDTYNLILYGEETAEGDFGTWNRKKGLRVDVTPDGIKQTYSYAEIIKGLKDYEINAKSYIKTGQLRTEQGLPVYGVAIGKDVTTFSENGKEQYNDGNKCAELTADKLTFYVGQTPNQSKVAELAGNELAFYQNGQKAASYNGTQTKYYIGGKARMVIDGTSTTINDANENKLVELKGNELGFYQNGAKVASYTGSRISFFSNGVEVFYIEYDAQTQKSKICITGEMEITSGGQLVINSGSTFIVQADNLTIDERGLTIDGGTVRANLYMPDGTPPLSKDDIVISTTQPAAAQGRIWIKPLDSVQAEYRANIQTETFANGSISKTLTGTAQTGQTGNNQYSLNLPAYSGTTSNITLDIDVSVTDGTNTITFAQMTIPHAYYESGGGLKSKFILNATLTDNQWIATANSLTITIAPVLPSDFQKTHFGIDTGQIELVASSTGSSGSGWKDCEIKVYQG